MMISEIVAYIVAQGAGTENVNLFKDFRPPTPHTCVTVTEYPGRTAADVWKFGQEGVQREYPRAQIVVRGEPNDYETPRLKAQALYLLVSKGGPSVMSGTQYYSITPLQPPFLLEKDGLNRYVFAVNFEMFKEVTAS